MSSEPVKDEVPEVEDNTFKVFAGNLAFATTEDDLKEAFAKAGDVVAAHIIVRNNRSLGYGFVSFATEEEAKKAVELLDKVELAGRPLNVEVAQPKAAGGEQKSSGRRRNRKAKDAAPAAEGAAAPEGGRGKRRGGREARIDQDGEEADGQEAGAEGTRKPRSRRSRKPRNKSANATSGGEGEGETPAGEGDAAGTRGRKSRRPKREKPAEDGPLSKTMLFVANIPFKVDSDALASIFKGFKVTTAKVVTSKVGRSKGFGFVEVVDEEEQKRVLSELSNVTVDGRELIIRIAHQSSHNPIGGEEEGEVAAAE
ncbi:hypothetical protein HDU97_004880 [Phlyctochytrium planicorne]|nr:hypothetical protein HDU97_004880 [Phlyctochytrium planicorne]